ncbi:hypothetical protein N181_28425 [Sinorhizobium fredii USDA 205]|nr:hypothetical protein N181_28425 [Sinorhizobium fredii USDA 205]
MRTLKTFRLAAGRDEFDPLRTPGSKYRMTKRHVKADVDFCLKSVQAVTQKRCVVAEAGAFRWRRRQSGGDDFLRQKRDAQRRC